MTPWLEIIVPVRNPGTKLKETVASLLAQTDRGFGVILSDNWSTNGLEYLDAAQNDLEASGITVRRVRPSFELGRVQHWNWAHAQSQAAWLKPLFVGDLLMPLCVQRLSGRVKRQPNAALVRFEFELRRPEVTVTTRVPFDAESLTAREFLAWYPAKGNWIGGPVNVAYRRSAWRAAGGYTVHLPVCADLNLYVTLALRHGLETIPETLAAFQLHDQRFSHGITKRRVNSSFELWLILRQARSFCRHEKLPWPKGGVVRGVTQQIMVDYWYPAKKRLKQLLLHR